VSVLSGCATKDAAGLSSQLLQLCVAANQKNVVVYLLSENGRYTLRGEFCTPGLIPVATLPELQMEWAEVFEGV